jgi:hypothetical protein
MLRIAGDIRMRGLRMMTSDQGAEAQPAMLVTKVTDLRAVTVRQLNLDARMAHRPDRAVEKGQDGPVPVAAFSASL